MNRCAKIYFTVLPTGRPVISQSVLTSLPTAKLKCHTQTKVVSVIELQFVCATDESAPHVRLLAGGCSKCYIMGLYYGYLTHFSDPLPRF
jgi:hypothetical protein